MFEIFEQPVEIPLDQLKNNIFVTLLCGGIVNPFGPTLTATGFLGNLTGNVNVVELTLNPFAQELNRVGHATISDLPLRPEVPICLQQPSRHVSLDVFPLLRANRLRAHLGVFVVLVEEHHDRD